MKKIILSLLVFGLYSLVADEFKFNPQTGNFNDLYEYCAPKFSKIGINIENKNNSKEHAMCKKYLDDAIQFYQKQCDNDDVKSCSNLSNIFYAGNGSFLPKRDLEKVYNFDKKLCELGDGKGCSEVGSYFSEKSSNESNKKQKKEYKKLSKTFYKKACELGYNKGCFKYKNY